MARADILGSNERDSLAFITVMLCSKPDMAYRNTLANISQPLLHPPLTALGEDGFEVAFEEGAGVLEVLFGVGLGGGEAGKRFVEDADDPLLFGERGDGYGKRAKFSCEQSMDTKGNFEFEREVEFRRSETLLDLRRKR